MVGGIAVGYTIAELLEISTPLIEPERRQNRGKEGPSYLRNYSDVFSEGAIEDYRLVKLSILLRNPYERMPDLEEQVAVAQPSLNGNRGELTKEVYEKLYDIGLRGVWRLSSQFSTRKLESLLREGEAEDLTEDAVLKAINYVATYKSSNPFFSWYSQIIRNLLIDLFRIEVKHNYQRFSDLFPEINQHAEDEISRLSDKAGYNFRSYLQDPLMAAISKDAAEKISQGFKLLKPVQQDALSYVMSGLGYDHAAILMGTSEGNVRVITFRARQAIGSYLELIGIKVPRSYVGTARNSIAELVHVLHLQVTGKGTSVGKKKLNKGENLRIAAAVFRENYIGNMSRSQLAHEKPQMYNQLRTNGLLDLVIPEKKKPGPKQKLIKTAK